MKKLLLLLLLLSNISIYAQKVDIDKVADNSRYISCSLALARDMTAINVLSFGLSAIQTENTTTYLLRMKITSLNPISVPDNAKLLIKCKDDAVIELNALGEDNAYVRDVHIIGNIVISDYSAYPIYPVTKEQIQQMCTGIEKVRIETSGNAIDKVYKKDKAGKIIIAEYNLITEALAFKKTFSDGF